MSIKKSNFPAVSTVPAGAYMDVFTSGANYKITVDNLIDAFGTTGSIVQYGNGDDTPVLDDQGVEKGIRNIADGSGIFTQINASNSLEVNFKYDRDTGGQALVSEDADGTIKFTSLLAGDGIGIDTVGDSVRIRATGEFAATKTVSVNSMSDFPDPVSGVITLEETTAYQVTNNLETANRFVFSSGSSIVGMNPFGASITYTGAGTLFTLADSGGNFIGGVRIVISGAGTVYSASSTTPNTGAFNIDNCTFVGGTIGTVAGLSTHNISNTSFVNITNGILFSGSDFNSVSLNRVNFISTNAACTFIDLNTATMDSFVAQNLYFRGVPGAVAFDGAAGSGNITANNLGIISFCRVDGFTDIFGASFTPDGAVRWQSVANSLTADTRPDALVYTQGNATVTTISEINTPVKIAATFAKERASLFSTDATGRITYIGERPFTTPVIASASLLRSTGTGSIPVAMTMAINGVSLAKTKRSANVSNTVSNSITLQWQPTLENGDYIEFFIENNDGTDDLLCTSATFMVN